MTDEPQTTALVRRDMEMDRFARLGQWLAASESDSKDPNALGAAAALRLFYADALNLPPMAAAELSVIKGRLFVQAKLLRALATRNGYRVVRTPDSDAKTCTAVLIERDTGEEIGRTTFTIEDAKTAGLIRDRSAWTSHPARMLWARASKYVLDDYAPEVTLGLATDDEAAEIAGRPAQPPPDDDGVEEAEWTAADASPAPAPPAPPKPPPPPTVPPPAPPQPDDSFYKPEAIEERQRNRLFALFNDHGITDRDERLRMASGFLERDLLSFNALTKAEATKLILLVQAYDPANPQTLPLPAGY